MIQSTNIDQETNRQMTQSPPREEQKLVNTLFDQGSTYWTNLYTHHDVFGVIHQQRRALALQYFDSLAVSKNARILEIGCGAGLTTIAIAQRGYRLEAMDSVPAMVELTKKHAQEHGVGNSVHVSGGDAHALAFPENSFDVILAMGVIPWLHTPDVALKEMTRILSPGGFIILNADNRYRLNHLLDPWLLPVLVPVKEGAKKLLGKTGLRKQSQVARPHMYTVAEFNAYLKNAGLNIVQSQMLGYGPFTIFNRRILSDAFGVKLQARLQRYANQQAPILSKTGSQYVVLAKK
jgi:ubiquinone/menaquinone biosynthesis C-methylase UbiE